MRWRIASVAGSVVGTVVFGAVLFAAADTTDWPAAWWWLGVFTLASVTISLTIDTALIRERMTGVKKVAGARSPADIWGGIFGVLFFGWLPLLALDAVRYRWVALPPWTRPLGLVLFGFANLIFWWVMRVNPYASSAVHVQDDRGQVVIDTGPYAVVRHPMYFGVFPFLVGTSLALGSGIGLPLAVFVLVPLAVRTWFEDGLLHDSLPGYDAYARRVRQRLIPFVW